MKAHTMAFAVPLAAMFAAAAAWAEQPEGELLPEMVVEAVRDSIIPAHHASYATVIDEKTIAQSGARSVADLLVTQGGLQLASATGNSADGQIRMHGFGENSNLRVLVVVDGQPINRPDMGGVSWLEVPLSQIERIEILRGSQTALYGDRAVAGVIHIVTKQGVSKPTGNVEVAAGSDGLVIARMGYRGKHDGNDLALNVEHNFTDGWRDNAASEVESLAVHWKREIFPKTIARIGVSLADEYGEFPGPLSKSQFMLDPRHSIYAASGYGDQYFNEQETLRTESSVLFNQGGDWTFEIPASFLHRDQSWNLGPGAHADNLLDTVSLTPTFKAFGKTWSTASGVSYRQDSLNIERYAQIARIDRIAEAGLDRSVAGLFTNGRWECMPTWHVHGALRWEHAEVEAQSRDFMFPNDPALNFSRENDEDVWAAQLGVRWEPRDDRAVWLRYDKLYRLPVTDEIAAYQGYPLQVPFNDDLRAETGHSVEAGCEWKPGAWTLGLNAFYKRLDNEILYDYVRNLNVNFAETQHYGVEWSGGYHSEHWEANVRYDWVQAEFTDGPYDGREVYLVPEHHVSAVFAVNPHPKWKLQLEWQATSSACEGNDFLNQNERLPGYQVANLMVRYAVTDKTSLYARVNNLSDERYATLKYSGVWYPAAGRQFQVGARYEF